MANLTGDFDVIAQFAVPAVNRVLAAMHRVERFPHSISMHVDDGPRPGHDIPHPSVVGIIDAFGDAVADDSRIRPIRPINIGDYPFGSPSRVGVSMLDAVVNRDIGEIITVALQPSHLKGKAQLQLSPPTIELSDASSTALTVRMGIMARYFPDPGTPPVAQFLRGDLRITAPVNQVASQVAKVVAIDIRSSSVLVNLTPAWSSSVISPQDLAGANLLIRNALKTSFLPSNSTLPENIAHIQFRTVTAGNPAVAVLLDMDGNAGNPATANQSFLSAGDGFVFGIGADYMRAAFQETLDGILEQQVPPVKFDINTLIHTFHITYVITLNNAAVDFENGKMVLVIKGHAHTGTSWMPDFNFTLKQDITLAVSGDTAELAFGSISFTTSSTIVNLFSTGAVANLSRVRDEALQKSGTQEKIREKLSAEKNLGAFLRSLLTPAHSPTPVQPIEFTLGYNSAEIRPTGVVLHGSVDLPDWPPPRAEYEPLTSAGSGPGGITPDPVVVTGPSYTALKSWIPGGTVEHYEWHKQGMQGYSDPNRFVLLAPDSPPTAGAMARMVSGYSPMCLTVHGSRLTANGPITTEPVAATVCGYRSFPVITDVVAEAGLIALARRGPGGNVEVIGHAAPMARRAGMSSPNLVIHFAAESSGDAIQSLKNAISESGREDTQTAVVLVSDSSRMARLTFDEAITYADDSVAWRRHFGIKGAGPATIVVDPEGRITARMEGVPDSRELAATLGKVLVRGQVSKPTMLTAAVRIGQPAPNILFEHAPGQSLTLRKLTGRKKTIVFFRQSSQPSVDAVRQIAADRSAKGDRHPVVLAITDSAPSVEAGLAPAIVVTDHGSRIAAAYGVTMWPTIVAIDEMGIVRSIAYGRAAEGGGKSRE